MNNAATHQRHEIESKVLKAVKSVSEKKRTIKIHNSLVTDLDFDSLRMVNLSIALEKHFNRTLLLNDWVSLFDDPTKMTVASLCEYISVLQIEEKESRTGRKKKISSSA